MQFIYRKIFSFRLPGYSLSWEHFTDAFGEEPGEEILKEWILQAQEQMPKELGRYLLEKTLQYADYRAKDDMTVLVAGIWRK